MLTNHDTGQVELRGMMGVAMDIRRGGAATIDLDGNGLPMLNSIPESLCNPCSNCQYLIERLEAIKKDFWIEGPIEYEKSGEHR